MKPFTPRGATVKMSEQLCNACKLGLFIFVLFSLIGHETWAIKSKNQNQESSKANSNSKRQTKHASAGTLCTMTINSDDETKYFKKYYESLGYKSIELTTLEDKKSNPDSPTREESYEFEDNTVDESWFQTACKQKIKCDILLISGHFGGQFFGKSNLTLSIQTLEKNSCNESCPGILSAPKEVYLFGCNTLAGKAADRRTPEEYRAVLIHDGFSPSEADGIAAARYSPISSSFYDTMRRVFKGPKVIYGFSSIAPSGKTISPLLRNYFDIKNKSRPRTDFDPNVLKLNNSSSAPVSNLGLVYNSEFMNALKITAVSQTTGLVVTEEGEVARVSMCEFQRTDTTRLDKLKLILKSIQEGRVMMFIPSIIDFFSNLKDLNNKRFSPDELSVLNTILKNEELKMTLLKMAKQLISNPTLQENLFSFFGKIGWLTGAEVVSERTGIFARLFSNLTVANSDTICSLDHSDLSVQREWFGDIKKVDKEKLKVLGCFAPSSELASDLEKEFERTRTIPQTQQEVIKFFESVQLNNSMTRRNVRKYTVAEVPLTEGLLQNLEDNNQTLYKSGLSYLEDSYRNRVVDLSLERLKKKGVPSFQKMCSFSSYFKDSVLPPITELPAGGSIAQLATLLLNGETYRISCLRFSSKITSELKHFLESRVDLLIKTNSGAIDLFAALGIKILVTTENWFKIRSQLSFKPEHFEQVFGSVSENQVQAFYKKSFDDEMARRQKNQNVDVLFCSKIDTSNANGDDSKERVYFWESFTSVSPDYTKHSELLDCLYISSPKNFFNYLKSILLVLPLEADCRHCESALSASSVQLDWFSKNSSSAQVLQLYQMVMASRDAKMIEFFASNLDQFENQMTVLLPDLLAHVREPKLLQGLNSYMSYLKADDPRRIFIVQNLVQGLKKADPETFWPLATTLAHVIQVEPLVSYILKYTDLTPLKSVKSQLNERKRLEGVKAILENFDSAQRSYYSSASVSDATRDSRPYQCPKVLSSVTNTNLPLILRLFLFESCIIDKTQDSDLEKALESFQGDTRAFELIEVRVSGLNIEKRGPFVRFLH